MYASVHIKQRITQPTVCLWTVILPVSQFVSWHDIRVFIFVSFFASLSGSHLLQFLPLFLDTADTCPLLPSHLTHTRMQRQLIDNVNPLFVCLFVLDTQHNMGVAMCIRHSISNVCVFWHSLNFLLVKWLLLVCLSVCVRECASPISCFSTYRSLNTILQCHHSIISWATHTHTFASCGP